jgi:predicted nucleic acid-binding protein
MTRYVFDTNQIVAAGTGWLDQPPPTPDPVCARRLLIHVAKTATGLYCGKMVGEYLEKLIDRKHPPERAARFIQYLLGAFERVEIVTQQARHPPSDPDDEIFVLCAIDGQAHYLISHDASLLDVAQHYQTFVICRAEQETSRLGI